MRIALLPVAVALMSISKQSDAKYDTDVTPVRQPSRRPGPGTDGVSAAQCREDRRRWGRFCRHRRLRHAPSSSTTGLRSEAASSKIKPRPGERRRQTARRLLMTSETPLWGDGQASDGDIKVKTSDYYTSVLCSYLRLAASQVLFVELIRRKFRLT